MKSWLLSRFLFCLLCAASVWAPAFAANEQQKDPEAFIAGSQFHSDVVKHGISGATALDLQIQARHRATHYRYKLGLAGATDCTDANGYSPSIDLTLNVVADISAYPDAEMVICLVAELIKKNQLLAQQKFSNATVYSWKKDTGAPVVLPSAVVGDTAFLTDIGDGISSLTSLNVAVEPRAGATHYQFTVGPASAADCASASGYSSARATTELLSADLSSVPDGEIRLCVIGLIIVDGAVVSQQPLNEASVYSWLKQTDTTPPAPFSILSPSGLLAIDKPEIVYEAAAGADAYDVSIALDAACSDPIASFSDVTTTTILLSSPLADGSYYVCVAAKDLAGNTTAASNNGLLFTIDATAPAAFSIVGPTQTVATKTPEVRWSEALGASSYDIVVSSMPDCSVSAVQVLDYAGTTLILPELQDGAYYTCIVAEDAARNSTPAANNGLSFSIDTAAPGAFSITAPVDVLNNRAPVVEWGSADGAASYDLSISTMPDCSDSVVSAANLPGLSYALPELPDGVYFTCLSAEDAVGNSSFAVNNGLSFEIDTAGPAAFSITAPVGVVASKNPTAAWDAALDAVSYDLRVSATADCLSPIEDVIAVSGTSFVMSDLPDGAYFTCVTAYDGAGNATPANNNGLSFSVDTTGPSAFTILSPIDVVTTRTPEASWSAADDAVSYDLVISSAADCSIVIQEASGLTVTRLVLSELQDGIYYSCVTARDVAGNVMPADNNGLSFRVDATGPGAFTILNPKGTIAVKAPAANWTAAPGAVAYDFIVSTLPDCSVPVQQLLNVTGISYILSAMQDGTYYSCVFARDDVGNVTPAANNGLSFTVKYTPLYRHKMFATKDVSAITVNQNIPPPYPRFGNLAGADWICTFAAYNAGLVPNWNGLDLVYKALLSTSTVNARDRIQIKGRIYSVCGRQIADPQNVWTGYINSAVIEDEYCQPVLQNNGNSDAFVWTGTRYDGTYYAGHNCGDWKQPYNIYQGEYGSVSSDSISWLNYSSQTCDKTAHLYCISPAME